VACSLVSGRQSDCHAAAVLGVRGDFPLPMAGLALAIFSVRRTTPERLPAGRVVPS
jgi:hypothetical protein